MARSAFFQTRSEIEASHAATAYRMLTGGTAAVVTSIGPGALHALAASLVPASNGAGVWYICGDETTYDEGVNLQQVPGPDQHGFLRLFSAMAPTYTLHTPQSAPSALRRGLHTVAHPYQAGPFFLLCPLNTQVEEVPDFDLRRLPVGPVPGLGPASPEDDLYGRACDAISDAHRPVIKLGRGSLSAGTPVLALAELIGAVVLSTPGAAGAVAYEAPAYLGVGGTKGSLSGNYAMEHADLLIAVGTRPVCQADCSRIGYPRVQKVININTDLATALHYNRSVAMVGDAVATVRRLVEELERRNVGAGPSRDWVEACQAKKAEWQAFKAERRATPRIYDPRWGRAILTLPAAVAIVDEQCRRHGAVSVFDAGDVQAVGFQSVEPDRPGQVLTDTGASYMGFGVSSILATAASDDCPYVVAPSGDGSFTMSPQILIDAVEHGARGCVVLLDNRRMGAISALQIDQYGADFGTSDEVEVDYVAWAEAVKGVSARYGGDGPDELVSALQASFATPGLSLVHVPVYFGPDPLGGLGNYGAWNVGEWTAQVQRQIEKTLI